MFVRPEKDGASVVESAKKDFLVKTAESALPNLRGLKSIF